MSVRTLLATLTGAARAAPVTLSVLAASLAAHGIVLALPGAFDLLVHSDEGLAAGQTWRLVTGHLVHLDGTHLLPNLVGLLALGPTLERWIGSRAVAGLLGAASLAIGVAVMLDSTVAHYCGLSGSLNALFAALCIVGIGRGPKVLWMALLAGGLAKIGWEWTQPALVPNALDWPPYVIAHLVGYVMGIVGTVFALTRRAAHRLAMVT